MSGTNLPSREACNKPPLEKAILETFLLFIPLILTWAVLAAFGKTEQLVSRGEMQSLCLIYYIEAMLVVYNLRAGNEWRRILFALSLIGLLAASFFWVISMARQLSDVQEVQRVLSDLVFSSINLKMFVIIWFGGPVLSIVVRTLKFKDAASALPIDTNQG
jgi:glucan phosphoethanolaminetransferase (alkaline phosphatase superfamily)